MKTSNTDSDTNQLLEVELLSSIQQGVFAIDKRGEVKFWNTAAEKLLGLSRKEVYGKSLTSVFKAHQLDGFLKCLNQPELSHSFDEYLPQHSKWYYLSISPWNGGIVGIFMDVSDKKQEEEELLENISNTREEEGNRIARVLHDGVVQDLVACTLQLNQQQNNLDQENKALVDITKYLHKITNEVRSISHQLIPGDFKTMELPELINRLKEHTELLQGIQFEFEVQLSRPELLPNQVKVHLYRILQELFNNIFKHSNAYKASVQVMEVDGILYVDVADNGKGIPDENLGDGIGLKNIRHRVQVINGKIDFKNLPQGGLMVSIQIPFNPS